MPSSRTATWGPRSRCVCAPKLPSACCNTGSAANGQRHPDVPRCADAAGPEDLLPAACSGRRWPEANDVAGSSIRDGQTAGEAGARTLADFRAAAPAFAVWAAAAVSQRYTDPGAVPAAPPGGRGWLRRLGRGATNAPASCLQTEETRVTGPGTLVSDVQGFLWMRLSCRTLQQRRAIRRMRVSAPVRRRHYPEHLRVLLLCFVGATARPPAIPL